MYQNISEPKNAPVKSRGGRVLQKKNTTGMPDRLKSGIENLSGYSMDDVKVHYNSPKPAQLQAHAYAQGTDIHLASGQERHLAHEAWHVVQQKQGRVKPTMQLKDKVNINDDVELEKEADVMGNRALQMKANIEKLRENKNIRTVNPVAQKKSTSVVQLVKIRKWLDKNTTIEFRKNHTALSRNAGIEKAKTTRQGSTSSSTVIILNNTYSKTKLYNLDLKPNSRYFLTEVHMAESGIMNWKYGFGDVEIHTNSKGKLYHLHSGSVTELIRKGQVATGKLIVF